MRLYFEQMTKRVVITGGPSSGKTTLINELVAQGMACLPEVSREITMEARANGVEQLFLENPILFSEKLLEKRIAQFFEAEKMADKLVFLDRGLPDVLAYMNYIGDSFPVHFEEATAKHVYDAVFILPPWEAIYTTDEARYETFEQASLIDKFLLEIYESLGYNPILIPKGTPEFRTDFVLKSLNFE